MRAKGTFHRMQGYDELNVCGGLIIKTGKNKKGEEIGKRVWLEEGDYIEITVHKKRKVKKI